VTTCVVHGCEKKTYARDRCVSHYQQHKRSGEPWTRKPRDKRGPTQEQCTVDGCVKVQKAKGLCKAHYNRSDHGRNARLTRTGPCTVEGCGEPRLARGLCQRHYNEWNRPKSSAQAREANLRRYGLTTETWQVLCDGQGGKCAICSNDLTVGGQKGSHVDHCHVTGKVRGILCLRCNLMLGYADDCISTLEQAIQYLADPPAQKTTQ
jgi:hypothetical protein